ncbi:MAG: metallophosphoesterase family protein [Pontibacterium sp.]
MPTTHVSIIGAIDGGSHYKPEQVLAALSNHAETLKLHAEFVGRPATRIYADQQHVLKLRDELGLAGDMAAQWVQNTLKKERALGVYHPHKTWLLLHEPETGNVHIGNISPRMWPLHRLFFKAPATAQERMHLLSWLTHVFELCLSTGKTQGIKLDEGLSNFTVSTSGAVYYVDDESYRWDGLVSFATMLAVFIRNTPWLDESFVRCLGFILRGLLDEIFDDITVCSTVVYQLKNAFIPAGEKQALCQSLCQILGQHRKGGATQSELEALLNACRATRQEAIPSPEWLEAVFSVTDDELPPTDMGAIEPDAEASSLLRFEGSSEEDSSDSSHDSPALQPSPLVSLDQQSRVNAETTKPAGESPPAFKGSATQASNNAFDTPLGTTTSTKTLAVLADIHANKEAFDAVLTDLDKQGIEQVIVLGDIVGYGPDPGYCIEQLQQRGYQVVKGNHDHGAATGNFDRGFSRNAKAVIDWTHQQLSDAHKEWLYYLPPILETPEWLAVHGAPIDPAFFYGYVYEMTYQDNLDHLRKIGRALCLHGHSHLPGAYVQGTHQEKGTWVTGEVVMPDKGFTLFCPGSVGQPRNGEAVAQYAVYHPDARRFEPRTCAFDVAATVEKMKALGFPKPLWDRLLNGR